MSPLRTALLGFLIFISLNCVNSLHILFFFPISTYSHRIPVWPLVEGLVEKGHNVTFVSPYPPKQPNPKVTEFAPLEVVRFVEENEEGPRAVGMRRNNEIDSSWWTLTAWGLELCELFLNSPDTQDWLKTSQFDLIVIDGLFNDCGLGLAHYFKAPHIVFTTSALFMWQYDAYGVPAETSWIPNMQYHYTEEMTFIERFWTTWNTLFWCWEREYRYFPRLTEILRKGLNTPDLPSLRDIEKNVSLVFMNSHFSEEYARSLPPLVVPVGGMHIKESRNPLPKEFEDFIAKSGDRGFVYISFGSAVQLAAAPPEIKAAFFDAVRRLSYINFIWKWSEELPEDIPPNVLMQKWIPQQEILAHPKIKGFITHGGLMSTQEAIYYGVPVVSMPVFAEQDYNAERVQNRGYGIRLEIITLTADKLVNAISSLINDPSYASKMRQLSNRFRDRPVKPVDLAMWWTEYVLRHGDTSHLKPKSIHQNWFSRRLFDVYGFSLALLAGLCLFIYKTVSVLLLKWTVTGSKQKTQ